MHFLKVINWPANAHLQVQVSKLILQCHSYDDLIDELPVEKRHLSKLIIICRI